MWYSHHHVTHTVNLINNQLPMSMLQSTQPDLKGITAKMLKPNYLTKYVYHNLQNVFIHSAFYVTIAHPSLSMCTYTLKHTKVSEQLTLKITVNILI